MMPLRTLAFTAALVALLTAAVFAFEAKAGPPWGPETPHFNLEVVLRGEGFGLVKFRQPNDADRTVYLDTWVRDLAPNRCSGTWVARPSARHSTSSSM